MRLVKICLLAANNRWLLLTGLLLFIYTLFALSVDGFTSLYNALNMTKYGVEVGLLAFGETLVIISGDGGIDLSVGSVLSLSAMTIDMLASKVGVNIWLASTAGLLIAIGCGLINGLLVSWIRVPPLLVTLSSMYIFDSLALLIAVDRWGNPMPVSSFPLAYSLIGQHEL